ncbi:FAD-dependent oxidoreductase [Bacillus lacus]|uniref:Dihydrolipoyl dehydrogenase n=1 Tax=Metabacillus lacus TaxID=1983721 RepID=A0A7X2IY70_9BACI|nr:NAD(P)/FAD-dependent oxidoreductase [Metabacillus lacus]MRX71834.1 FAD-dependent oxidoreductase [Metabacillus lacus]
MVVGELAHERELIIIGGGPGGYHAAIRASQLGKKVTLVEREALGGVCLNKGCIPSKVLAYGAERLIAMQQDHFLGISAGEHIFDLQTLMKHKDSVIQNLRQGVEGLMKANKVEVLKGSAFFLSENKIGVEGSDSYDVYSFSEGILAVGGTPVLLEDVDHAEKGVLLNPWTIMELKELPQSLILYGNDYITLELAMAFHAFGSNVTIVLPEGQQSFPFDSSINKELSRILKKTGIAVVKGVHYKHAAFSEGSWTLALQGEKGPKTVEGTHLFYSLGTKPSLQNLGLDRLPIILTEEGLIETDQAGRTSIPHIFAIGDITEGPQLAVKAIQQGKTAAEVICGRNSENNHLFLPVTARTSPPIACAGLTEERAALEGYSVRTGEFALSANGYSSITGSKEGLLKVVIDGDNDMLLGVHAMGRGAIELISSGVLSLEMAARAEDLTFAAYPHPSLNEALLEAAEAFRGESIHSIHKAKISKVRV